MEGQEFNYSFWDGFYQFLTVLFDSLSRYHIGIMVSVTDDHHLVYHGHKHTAWGCGRMPNAEKLAIIREKIFKIWAKCTATFTCNEVVPIFQTETNNNQINGKIMAKTLPFFLPLMAK